MNTTPVKEKPVRKIPGEGYALALLPCVTFGQMYRETRVRKWLAASVLLALFSVLPLVWLYEYYDPTSFLWTFGGSSAVAALRGHDVELTCCAAGVLLVQWGIGAWCAVHSRAEYWDRLAKSKWAGTDWEARLRAQVQKKTGQKKPLVTSLSMGSLWAPKNCWWCFLSFLGLAWVGFGWAGGRTGVRRYWAWAVVYLAVAVLGLAVGSDTVLWRLAWVWQTPQYDIAATAYYVWRLTRLVWVLSIPHSFLMRKEYLLYREAHDRARSARA